MPRSLKQLLTTAVGVAGLLGLAIVLAPAIADGDNKAHQHEAAVQDARRACYSQHDACRGVTIWNLRSMRPRAGGDGERSVGYAWRYRTECGWETYVNTVDVEGHGVGPLRWTWHQHARPDRDEHRAAGHRCERP
jgi:hypothetical protein